jgi:photosystem II stability/assembly factor-like uncharacterized protein
MSGRISAMAANREPNGKIKIFVGAASGGVWRSEDGGTTFKSDLRRSAGAIDRRDHTRPEELEVVWVGTGESWTRNSVSIGNGIYKSTDNGDTWQRRGLADPSGSRDHREPGE